MSRTDRSRKGRRRGVRRALRATLWGLIGLVVLGVAGFAIAYALVDVPQPNDRAVAEASVLYYSDGETEMDRISKVNREAVELDQVPEDVQRAFIAAEDRSFYENRGISPKGIVRAVSVALRGGEQQGGSTITQQYVKNYFLTQDQTYTRKAKEVLISLKVDGELSKDQILENYLNTIYFGRGADGIQTASQAYFRKDVEELSASEGAFLASVIKGPSRYDPALGEGQRDRAEGRWDYVLDGMVGEGWMTAAERDRQEFPEIKPPPGDKARTDDIGFVTEEVRAELRSRVGLSDADLARGGFEIVTTIDKDAQQEAAKAVEEHRPTEDGTSDVHIGLASIEPDDGAIRAMYGGPRFGKGRFGYFNAAVDGKMQAGSTMKPFTMIAALRRGMPLSTTYSGDSPFYDDAFIYEGEQATEIQGRGGVVNYGGTDHGPVDMREATKRSVNTYYARLNLAATPRATAQSAKDAGVRAWNGNKQVPVSTGPGNVFGTDSVRVLDMANAYATIAAEGRGAEPYYISSVTGSGEHEFDYEVDKEVERAFPQDVARDAIRAMSGVDSPGGTGHPTVAELDRPVGGKTGTTSDNYAAWFDGFTPGQLATAVGMYKGDGRLIEKNRLVDMGGYAEVTGGTIPASIWTDYMVGALKGEPVEKLPPAGNVTSSSRSDSPTDAPAPITSTSEEPDSTSTRSGSPSPSSTPSTTSGQGSRSSSTSSAGSTSSSSSSRSPSTTSSSTTTSRTSEPTSTSSSPTTSRLPSPTTSTPPPTTEEEPPTTEEEPTSTRPSTSMTRPPSREAPEAESTR